MAITALSRDWGVSPSIVRMTCTDTLSTITSLGYMASQTDEIEAIQNGEFEWLPGDYVLINYSGGEGFFTFLGGDIGAFIQENQLFYTSFGVTATEFKGSYAAPVLIETIPSPGVDYIIEVQRWAIDLAYNSVQYAAGGDIGLQYDDTVHGAGVLACGTIPAASINGLAADGQVGGLGAMGVGSNANQRIYLSNQTAAFTTGDSDMNICVYYSIRAL